MQEVVDSECRNVLTRGRTESEVRAHLQAALGDQAIAARISAVSMTRQQAKVRLSVEGSYHGPLLDMLNFFVMRRDVSIPFAVSGTLRHAGSVAMVLFDRSVPSADVRCSDPVLAAIEQFAAVLTQEVAAVRPSALSAGVFPSEAGEVEPIFQGGEQIDRMERCDVAGHMAESASVFSVAGIEGSRLHRVAFLDSVRRVVTTEVLTASAELYSVTIVLRGEHYASGLGQEVLEALDNEAYLQQKRLRVVMIVVDGGSPREERSSLQRAFGIASHTLFITKQDLGSPQLQHAVTQAIVGRAVIER
jgi:hypothetical protein